LGPGPVEDLENGAPVLGEAGRLERAHAQAGLPRGALRLPRETLGEAARDVAPGVEVFQLAASARLEQIRVPGGVVRHHDEWRRVETLDEQTTLMIEAEIDRSDRAPGAPLGEPGTGCAHERFGGPEIVLALEETERPVGAVDPPHGERGGGRDPAHGAPAAAREEEHRVPPPEE